MNMFVPGHGEHAGILFQVLILAKMPPSSFFSQDPVSTAVNLALKSTYINSTTEYVL